ncbi:MAG: cardiolipin synthase [Deltaproteobacteria bacterium]|nr:cardiolipin synthase [Deltaproteobacteria bacterium]
MHYLVDLLRDSSSYPGWWSLLMLASQLLALATAPSVLLQRQGRPRAALSWLLALFALPALGVFFWWAFGRTSFTRRRRLRRAGSSRRFVERHGPPHSEPGTPFDGLLPPRALGESMFPSHGNRIELLLDGERAFVELEALIRSARTRVHVMFYIYRDDATGQRIARALSERARAGVNVRVLVDAWASREFLRSPAAELRAAGVAVAGFLPARHLPLTAPRLNFSNHRKLVVVDGEHAITGGMNVGDEYARDWRDLMVHLEGPSVLALDHVFLDDWAFATGEDVDHPEHSEGPARGPAAAAIVASGPDRESFLHDAYFVLFTRATRRIWIVTPYFIPGDAIATALRTAAGRGVDVRVLVPQRSDVRIVKHASRSYYSSLLAGGVRIYEYQGPMLHAKAFLVDDAISSVGSANVDTRSFLLSFEIGCLVHDADTAAELSRWYSGLLADSHEVTLEESTHRPASERLLQSAAHLLSPLL